MFFCQVLCTALTDPSVIPTLLTGYNPAWQLLPTTILTDKPMLFSNSMEVCLGGFNATDYRSYTKTR